MQRLLDEVDGVDVRLHGGTELRQGQPPDLVVGGLLPHSDSQQRAVQLPVARQPRGQFQRHVSADVDVRHLPDLVSQ